MSEPKSSWAKARKIREDVKDLIDQAYAENEDDLYHMLREVRRLFDHPNFTDAESRNHRR